MNNLTRKLGATALLIALSMLAIGPAMAEHRRDYKNNRHQNNRQSHQQSYYNQNYGKHRYGRSSGRHVQSGRHQHRHGKSCGHGRGNDNYSGYGSNYSGYSNYSSGYGNYYGGQNNYFGSYNNNYGSQHSGYQSDYHRHRHGIVVLRGPAYGYSYCDSHGGYYRRGDIYY